MRMLRSSTTPPSIISYRRRFGSTTTTTTSQDDDSKTTTNEETTLGAAAAAEEDPHMTIQVVQHPNEEQHPPAVKEEEQPEVPPLSDHPRNDNKNYYTVPVEIKMPDMSEGNDNTVETWYKQPGDLIRYNDILCDIATQDFTFGLSIDDEHDAIMGDIHVEAGSQAPDGAPICTIYHPNEEEQEKAK